MPEQPNPAARHFISVRPLQDEQPKKKLKTSTKGLSFLDSLPKPQHDATPPAGTALGAGSAVGGPVVKVRRSSTCAMSCTCRSTQCAMPACTHPPIRSGTSNWQRHRTIVNMLAAPVRVPPVHRCRRGGVCARAAERSSTGWRHAAASFLQGRGNARQHRRCGCHGVSSTSAGARLQRGLQGGRAVSGSSGRTCTGRAGAAAWGRLC